MSESVYYFRSVYITFLGILLLLLLFLTFYNMKLVSLDLCFNGYICIFAWGMLAVGYYEYTNVFLNILLYKTLRAWHDSMFVPM